MDPLIEIPISELELLKEKEAKLRKAVERFVLWYDGDGTHLTDVMPEIRAALG